MSGQLQPLAMAELEFSYAVGVGGIGSGVFFRLEAGHTMLRNESRAGQLMPWRDYCKQHIILHYLSVLLGAGKGGFSVYPIGAVGSDPAGLRLLDEMGQAGMDTHGIRVSAELPTMYSVCFQYPDGSGGNITSSNSANASVSPEDVLSFLRGHAMPAGRGIGLAAPEVPLPIRAALLEQGRRLGWLNATSLLAAEADAFRGMGLLALTGLLAVNREEAEALAGVSGNIETTAGACLEAAMRDNPDIMAVITDGKNGCYAGHARRMQRIPSLPAEALSTAGAGDALLAGTLAGLACGLPLVKEQEDGFFGQTPLSCAVELGTLLASLSVTSEDTIHHGVDREALGQWATAHNLELSIKFAGLFE